MALIDSLVSGVTSAVQSSSDAEDQSTHAAAPAAYLSSLNPTTQIFLVVVAFVLMIYALHVVERVAESRRGGRKG